MDLSRVIKELKKGNNIERNLSLYGNAMAKSYYNMASYMLAMNLSANYDLIQECDCHDAGYVRELFGRVVKVIEAVVVNEDLSELAQQTKAMFEVRDAVVNRTDAFDAYTYILQIYEHLMNRAEYRFKKPAADFDLDDFKDRVMIYISGNNDAETINERIQSVMSELPVRLTTSKFFDIMTTCSQCYKGIRNDMAEEYFYHLKQCARPLSMEGLDPSWPVLHETCKKMLALDVEHVSEEACSEAMKMLRDASVFIAENFRAYLFLIDIVNDLLVMLLTVPYVMNFTADMRKSAAVVKEIISAEKKGTFLRPDEDIVGLLRYLTDRQPVYQGEHMMLEDALYVIVSGHQEALAANMMSDLYDVLQECAQLSATTVLSALRENKSYFPVDTQWLNAHIADAEAHFGRIFDGMTRPFKRAVMALTFSCMPVVFNSLDDMADYIVRSIDGCRDEAERTASIAIITEMMEQG